MPSFDGLLANMEGYLGLLTTTTTIEEANRRARFLLEAGSALVSPQAIAFLRQLQTQLLNPPDLFTGIAKELIEKLSRSQVRAQRAPIDLRRLFNADKFSPSGAVANTQADAASQLVQALNPALERRFTRALGNTE